LEISGLENVTETFAKRVRLEHKEKITHLSLKWDSKGQEEPMAMDCHKKVLYALKPHDCLQMLNPDLNPIGDPPDFQIWILGQLTFHSTYIHRLRHGTI
jgi:hypothetical protein